MNLQNTHKSGYLKPAPGLLALAATLITTALSMPATATDSNPSGPYVPEGNAPNYKHECPNGLTGFKMDLDEGYEGKDETTGVIFKLSSGDNKTINWSAHYGAVSEVAVAGGSSTHVFKYNPAVASDSGLYAPDNKGGQRAGVSHITFCYDPAKANIKVTKTCKDQWQTKTYDGFISKNAVVIENTGNVALKKIYLKEALSNCKVTYPGEYKTILKPGDFTEITNLSLPNKGDKVTLTVRCKTGEPNVINKIVALGKTGYGFEVKDKASSDPYTQCKFVHKTKVRVEKTCVDDSVHLKSIATDSMGDLLAVRVCPSIVIHNKSTEPLKHIKVYDPSIDLLANGGYALTDAILYQDKSIDLAEWIAKYDPANKGKLCYYPDAPAAHDGYAHLPLSEATPELYDPNAAAFFNRVTVEAEGKFTGAWVGDKDTTYYKNKEGEWVAECPLCSCPDDNCGPQTE